MSQFEFDDILRKYLKGDCTPAEEKRVLEWYNTFIKESEIELSAEQKELLEDKLWAKIQSGTDNFTVPAKVKLLHRPWIRIAAAACLIGVIATALFLYFVRPTDTGTRSFTNITIPEKYKIVYNRDNTLRSVTLSDGSVIELQPQSSLYYPEQFSGSSRDVYLSGNAFFKVAHDTSMHFIVHTDEGLVTEVLGTSFYIQHDKVSNKIEVSVITGKVSVYKEKSKNEIKTVAENKIILTPNQKVTYKPVTNQFITTLVEEPKLLETADNKQTTAASFDFEEARLSEIIKVLEAAYGISIQTENEKLNHCHFTGDLTKQNLYDKLDIICKSILSSYEIKGTIIYLKGEGCN